MSQSVRQRVKLLPMPECNKPGSNESSNHWNARIGKYLLLIDGPTSRIDLSGIEEFVTCDGPFYKVAEADCLDGAGWICAHSIEIGD